MDLTTYKNLADYSVCALSHHDHTLGAQENCELTIPVSRKPTYLKMDSGRWPQEAGSQTESRMMVARGWG